MDKKRIKRAINNCQRYLSEGKIKKVRGEDDIIYQTYLKNSNESLLVAQSLMKQNLSPLWIVVSSYYSMFYISSAYLYRLGYKTNHEIVHQVVNEMLIARCRNKIKDYLLTNYSEEKDKALEVGDNHLRNYEFEKNKRATFQYQTTEAIKNSKALTSFTRAKEFIALIRNILNQTA